MGGQEVGIDPKELRLRPSRQGWKMDMSEIVGGDRLSV